MQLPDFSDFPKCPYKSHCCERIMPIWAMLTKRGHHENLQTKQTAKDTHEARVFCRLLLEERLLKFPSGMKA